MAPFNSLSRISPSLKAFLLLSLNKSITEILRIKSAIDAETKKAQFCFVWYCFNPWYPINFYFSEFFSNYVIVSYG